MQHDYALLIGAGVRDSHSAALGNYSSESQRETTVSKGNNLQCAEHGKRPRERYIGDDKEEVKETHQN